MTRLIISAAALILLPAACSDEPAPAEPGAQAPMAEVLEGSISDDMIPYDRLRSQPPLAEIVPGTQDGGTSAAQDGGPAALPPQGGEDGAAADAPAPQEQPPAAD